MITAEHLTRTFASTVAVEDLSFHLDEGEVVGFLGPNGAGKTTTMRILAGYLPATSGSVRIAGLDVLRRSLEVRQKLGYLPESVPLYREHRVREMLEFQGRLHGMRRVDYVKRIPEVLERVGIGDRIASLIGHLSRGQRQRVGLAVALLPNPEVLILDEPTSGLDPLQRVEVRELLRELANEHTVLLSSHILPEVEAVCPRVIILNKGRIAADGTQKELVRQLGQPSHVRLEAMVGADVDTALRLLRAIPGVHGVVDAGRLGIHHQFTLECDEDLREDAGALAAQRGWALRELSWHLPNLEDLFARIALGLEGMKTAAPTAPRPVPENPLMALGASPAPAPSGKLVYNLNPFDQGAQRDLKQPKAVDGPALAPGGSQPADAACDTRLPERGDT
jgi:ABC-2 type transport system ATP-binding protein